MRTKAPYILGCVIVALLAAFLPSYADAQRHRGGSARLSTAVPRAPYSRPNYPRHYYPRYNNYPRYHYPRYYYPRYYYPRYYHPGYYPGYYYPGFSFGVGIGYGVGLGFGVGYGYGYPAYPTYPSYPAGYYAPYGYGQQYSYERPNDPRIQVTPPEYPARESAPSGEYGTLSIRVQPADAEIFVDGEQWHFPESGQRLVLEIPEGPHRIEIRKEALEPYATTVYIRAGRAMTLNVSLPRGSAGR
jgi:PEGA domain